MRIDYQKAAGAPSWLPETPRPGQILTPQVPHLGIRRSGRRGDAQDLRAAWRSGHLGRLASGCTRGTGTQKHGHPSCRFTPPAGAAPGGKRILRASRVASAHTSSCRPPHTLSHPSASGESRLPGSLPPGLWLPGPRSSQIPLGPPSLHIAGPRTQMHPPRARRRCRARTHAPRPARVRKPWLSVLACAVGRG